MNGSCTAKRLHSLVIVGHVVHYCSEGGLFAYGPYAPEIDVWADLKDAQSPAGRGDPGAPFAAYI
jgi:hypothetical protein